MAGRYRIARARRRGAGVAVAAALALTVSACGSSASPSSSSTTDSTKTSTASSKSSTAKSITITEQDYYTSGSAKTAIDKVLASYMKLHPNVHIKISHLPGSSYVTKVLEEASSGSMPNLMMLDNPYVDQIAGTGRLVNLQTLGHISPSRFMSSVYSAALFKGKLWAMPLYTNTIALFYNKPMLTAAHVTPPKTWAQLLVDAKKLTGSGHYGITFQGQIPSDGVAWMYEPFLWSNGGHLRHLSSKPAAQALTLYRDLVKEGAAAPTDATANYTQQNEEEAFAAGKVAMMINGPWNFPALQKVKGLKYGVVPLPVRKPGQKLIVPLGGEFWTIPKTNPAAEKAAFKVLQYMSSTKVDAKLAGLIGDVPSVKAALPLALKQENPLTKPFVSEIQTGGRTRTKYIGAAYNNIANGIDPLIDQAILGHVSVTSALKQMAAKVKSGLASTSS